MTDSLNGIPEDSAVKQIIDECHTGDCEGDGCRLDDIVKAFLESHGYYKLVAAIEGVECWRA